MLSQYTTSNFHCLDFFFSFQTRVWVRNISKCVPEKHHLTLYIKSPLDPRKTDMSFKLSSLAKCIIVHSFILYLHLCFISLSSNFILAMKCHTKHTIYSQEKQKYNTGATKATNVIEKKY